MRNIERMESSPRMSRAVIVGDMVYLCGLAAVDVTEPDIRAQTEATLKRVEHYLKSAGSDMEHVVVATIWLKNLERDYDGMNEIWDRWFPHGAPARATVEARLTKPSFLVEIMVQAVRKPGI
ncbi:Enamine deaminase RidA (YjgF/YER057c/UK114 family) OS=Castellaniella defragrans OX=75697 GN=HNR28_001231 PE=4 SV=1 [Castellaniella defragrans]